MTQDALERLVDCVADIKRDDPLAPVTVIVPSNLAGRSLGWRLAAGLTPGRRAVAGIRITTVARLAEMVAAVHLHPRRPLLPSILAAAWRAELEAAASTRPGWEFAEVWQHPTTVAALARTYHDLREVPAGSLPLDRLGSVTAETVRLSSQVRDRLAADWYDQQDLFAAASRLVAANPGCLAEFGTLVRYLVTDEPLSALTFLDALDAAVSVSTITDDGPRLADRVLHASDSDDEVRVVVREVVSALSGGEKARRLAVLYTRPDPYVRIIHAQLAAAGIGFNGRGGIPVAEMSSSRAFLGLLDLPRRGFPRAGLFEVLSTWPLKFPGTDVFVPTVTWERVSREANVAGGDTVAAGWVRRLDDFAAQKRNVLKKPDAETLRDFVTGLQARLVQLDASSSWESVSQQCLALLDDLFGDVADIKGWEHDEKRAFVTLRSTLTGLVSLDEYRAPRDLNDVIEVLTAQLAAAVPRTGRFGQGVFVGPLTQARGLDLDRVWVVGLSEDLYPGRQAEDALLPDWLRASTPGLVSAAERVERMERDLLAAFAAATLVTASFPRGDLRASTEKLPSRLLLPSLQQLVGKPDLAATEWSNAPHVAGVLDCASFAQGILTTPRPATVQEWSMRLVRESPGLFDDPAFLAARELQRNRSGKDFTRFDGNLSGVDGLPVLASGQPQISPTALESYASCPFAYFVKRMLGVEPVQEPTALGQVTALDVGNIFHYAMDRFITAEKESGTLPGAGEPWLPEHYARLDAFADEVIAEFEVKGSLGHPTLWGFQEPRIRVELTRMLDDDSHWRAGVGAAPVDSELAFGDGDRWEHPAVDIDVDGGAVRFVGSADKVDRVGDTIHVTDIKTGKRDPFAKIDPKRGISNPTVDGTKLQLPIYAKAALQAYPGARQAEAQYWFVHGDSAGARVRLALTPELEQLFSHVVGTLVGGIAHGHFFRKPSKNPGYLWVDCEFCTPGGVGHEAARTGYVHKRAHPDLLTLLEVIDPEGAEKVRAGIVEDQEEDHE